MNVRYMFLFLLLSVFIIFSTVVIAQDDAPKFGWKKSVVGDLNLTQTSFDNWAQGGENSFAWQFNFNFNFTNNQENYSWANSGKLTYGSLKAGDEEFRKSIDEIKLESVYTYLMNAYINPFVAATGESQMTAGYKYNDDGTKTQIAAFMDPGYLRESAGVGYSKNDIVKTRLGVALKQTFSSDYPYADDPETKNEIEKFKNEIGAESVTDLNWKIASNSLLTSKLELFSNIKGVKEIDVNWDNVLSTKISKYVAFNFNVKLLYDKDISAKRQIKQAIALGLTYSFL
ncbi:DUF3078 domain-containing protein [candidate division KSB1 bacterium]|nr:DUF3078 domain-containing protein [candidate division KSB1 bacterium]